MRWQPMETAPKDGFSVVLLHVVTFEGQPFAKVPIPEMRHTEIAIGGWHTPPQPGEDIAIVRPPDPDRGHWSAGYGKPISPVAWAPIPVTTIGMDGLPILPWSTAPKPFA